ncbi:hypothetical protein FF124_13015 [Martelella lutilitoris]|uniref:Uncharacterized protein n=1 Tax=Martelella lutilitoris TaxID=2583532 RepID=A0A5C4JQX0_9HYPH|nr:CRISPR-associated protein Csx19 [Martelella lutilitoris]TNB47099.1 hypothetical protein FF124_13015 [Martelella lutilitoris]
MRPDALAGRLVRSRFSDLDFAQAVRSAFGDTFEGTGFFFAPTAYRFVRFRDGEAFAADGASLDVSAMAFEAVAFAESGMTLRWVRSGASGSACLMTPVLGENEEAAFHIPVPHLLWGEPAAPAENGWTRLTSARIGTLDVPADIADGQRARLMSQAWFAADTDRCGNSRFLGTTYSRIEAIEHKPGGLN